MAKRCIISLAAALSIFISCSKAGEPSVPDGNWEPTVSQAISDFIKVCNKEDGKEYVVFDFDNTCSIFDISEQLLSYQLETMSFELTPEEFREAVFCNLSTAPQEVLDRLGTIASGYSELYGKYGPFSYDGLSEQQQSAITSDSVWLDFAIGIVTLYDNMMDLIDTDTAYVWLYQLYSGMTPDQLYALASRSHERFSKMETTSREWVLGDRKHSWLDGISVTEEIKGLWKSLHDNGIDIWVCSASCLQPVMAAVDVFGLHEYCSGVVAYVYKKDETGKLLPEYDYSGGCGAIARKDGSWEYDTLPLGATSCAEGKVTAILNAIAPRYSGKGPSAGFGDSSGDFNFCTEFESLKMVIFFNRATRKITEGGGLIAELAMYQKDVLGYDLAKANANGDTFYLLQGRDENGYRTLRKSHSTVTFGASAEKLFCNEDNYTEYGYFKREGLSTKDILNSFAFATPAGKSPFGLKYGFLTDYRGYHSIR